jgi:hypothetical protein
MWTDSPLLRDAGAAVLTGVTAGVVLRFWEEVANRALLDQVTPLLSSSLASSSAWCFLVALTNLVTTSTNKPINQSFSFGRFTFVCP